MTPDLSIIIVNYNSHRDIERCLRSIYQWTRDLEFEVIVVDNNSPDRGCVGLESLFPQSRFHFLASNEGFGAANNAGFAQSNGENVVFLNPDTLLTENSFRVLLEYLGSHQDVGAISPMLVYPDSPLQYCYNAFPGLREEMLITLRLDVIAHRWMVKRDYLRKLSKGISFAVDWVAGACLCVRREVLLRVGLFDPAFFLFFEDIDLCARIRSAGYTIHYTPSTRIIHLAGQSTSSNQYALVLHRYRSKYLYLHKHVPRGKRFVLLTLSLLGLVLRWLGTFVVPFSSQDEKLGRRQAYGEAILLALHAPTQAPWQGQWTSRPRPPEEEPRQPMVRTRG